MANSATPTEKAEESITDQDRADKASDAFMVGVDQQGREHYYSRIRNAMTVCSDGEHIQTESLNDGTLSGWMRFIDEEFCGWSETNVYSGSTVQHLAEQLATAVNGGGN